ncbi:MAG: DUF5119 domain-containing protein, partial [Muribaculaceae bacterium]|nr:DUF5119 domain-containing protein [Muribaculaceae bacterium]
MKNARASIMSRIPILILTVWTAILAASCTEKDIVFDGENINVIVEFDWQEATEANPEGMTLILFPADGKSKSWRFDISGRDGGQIELLSGIYNVLVFNNDLPGIEFTNTDDYNLFSANARNISDSLTSPTGMLYSAALSDVALFPTEDAPQVIRMKPDPLSTAYHITIDSVSGTQRIRTAYAVMRGIARSVCLCLQCNSTDTCSISTPMHIAQGRPDRLETVATGFGNPDIVDPKIFLDVIVTTSHGKYS